MIYNQQLNMPKWTNVQNAFNLRWQLPPARNPQTPEPNVSHPFRFRKTPRSATGSPHKKINGQNHQATTQNLAIPNSARHIPHRPGHDLKNDRQRTTSRIPRHGDILLSVYKRGMEHHPGSLAQNNQPLQNRQKKPAAAALRKNHPAHRNHKLRPPGLRNHRKFS